MSAVDVELCDKYFYVVIRKDVNGEPYCVTTHTRIVVMKSHETGEDAVYLRVFIPDKYESDLSDCALSCEQRNDFSGIEYFSTPDGKPVAAARFRDGHLVDKIFLGDTAIPREERTRRFYSLIGDMIVCRCDSGTRIMDDLAKLKPGTKIIDEATGTVYICYDADNDGKTDSVTQVFADFDPLGGGGGNGSNSSGEHSSGSLGGDSNGGNGYGGGTSGEGSGSSGGECGGAGTGNGGDGAGIGGGFGGFGVGGSGLPGGVSDGSDSGTNTGDGSGSGDGTNSDGDGNGNDSTSGKFWTKNPTIDPFINVDIDGGKIIQPTPKRKPDINLGDKDKFAGYKVNVETDCLALCKKICDNYNISDYGSSAHVFKLTHEVNGVLTHYGNDVAQNYKNAIACIDRHLEAGRPIIVGVNYFIGRGINEKTTDHFVVIYGRGYDSNTGCYYYNYYEVGRRIEYGYDDSSNRFIYEPSIPPYFYDPESNRKGRERYDVVQVRPNAGDISGTIPQDSK